MTIDKISPYNADFWNYLKLKLKEYFKNTALNYNFMMYPSEISVHSISQKTKTNVPTVIYAKIIFFMDDNNEMEYATKISLGTHSRKAYINTKGTDLTKCFPNSKTISDWMKIDELKKEIQIDLL